MSLLVVVDALGHGPRAGEVSSAALTHLQHADITLPLEQIVDQLHRALAGSRGAAATLLRFTREQTSACGIGNVELRSTGIKLPFRLTAGILGKQMRKLHVARAPSRSGRFALYSDGLSSRFYLDDYGSRDLGETCTRIFDEYARATDDASLLLAEAEFD